MRVLQGDEPASVLAFFEDICSIPHISYHEQQLSDYCVAFAKERNLYYEQDKLGNVVIIKEAPKGYLARYAKLVSSADKGAILE